MADEGPAVGIDLGTTYSCVAVVENDQIKIIHGDDGQRIMASCVYFNENGDRIIGNNAKELSVKTKNPENAIFGVKRFIGRTYEEFKLQENKILFPYVVKDQNGRPSIVVSIKNEYKTFAPEEISAMVLSKLKERAEEHLRKKVSKAVITVPAHFNAVQRQATINAGKIAGLEVLRIINEPTAAALAYEMENKYKNNCNVLVYDFGGGTFDVSVVSINQGVLDVKATNGEAFLGGDDIDQKLTEYFVKEFRLAQDIDLCAENSAKSKTALRRLRQQAEKAKINLSSALEYQICIDFFYNDLDFETSITRFQLNQIAENLFAKTMNCVEKTLNDAKMSKRDIDEIVLVGGTTRIPHVREMVKNYFGGKDYNASIHPDEAVAIGAARQAAILDHLETSKRIGNFSLVDVCTLSIGIETDGGIMSVILPRNTKIPAEFTKEYVTSSDNQRVVDIMIFEGERKMTRDNRRIDQFELSGIRPAPRGSIKIVVTFSIDEDGILHAKAVEKYGKLESSLSVNIFKNQLSEAQIKTMLEQAEEFKEQDRKLKEKTISKIQLQNLCHDYFKQIENSQKIQDPEKIKLKKILTDILDIIRLNKNMTKEQFDSKINFVLENFRNIRF